MALKAIMADLGRLQGLLARGERPDVRAARSIASSLRRALAARPPAQVDVEQLGLALRYAAVEAMVPDCPLGCPVRAVVCIARQVQSDHEINGAPSSRRCHRRADPDRPVELARHDGKRGTLASRPTCVTAHCPTGAAVRALLGDVPEAVEMAKRAPRCTDTAGT